MKLTQIRRIVERELRRWRAVTGTSQWTVTVTWEDVNNELDGSSAGCRAFPEYRSADIVFDLERIKRAGQTVDQISYDVLHELCHCLTWWLFKLAVQHAPDPYVSDANELSTTDVARSIWVAYYRREPPD